MPHLAECIRGIPVAAPDAFAAPVTGALHYSIDITQFTDRLHPALDATTLWGYHPGKPLGGGNQPPRHLGGIVIARGGMPIQLTFTNHLPPKHILPVDVSTFMDAANNFKNGRGPNAACTHSVWHCHILEHEEHDIMRPLILG